MATEKTFQVGPLRVRVSAADAQPAPKERLSRDRIVDVALAQMKERGYEAVSMRSIAKELGTGPASLYAHVANRDELDSLVIDRIARQADLPAPDPERWDEQLKAGLRGLLAAFREHPGSARATLGMIPTLEGTLVHAEAMMALCRAGGIQDQYAAWAADVLALYVASVAVEEDVWVERGKAAAAAGRPYTEEDVVAAVHAHFRSLAADRFPILSSLADVMTTGDGEERFEFGITLLVEGLKAVSAQARAREA
jgi:AcrR family transcriptional regulator